MLAEEGKSAKQFFCSQTKKNVFLIGDSMRIGYCAATKEALSDLAEVFYVADNCRNTQYVITRLLGWSNMFSDPGLVDVVHFNCGHWDIAHWCHGEYPLTSEEEYARNIRIIIDMLRKLFPRAKIVFAATTPMNPSGEVGVNYRTTEDIIRYNEIAKTVAEEQQVAINDLFAVTKDWDSTCYRDYCHLVEESAVTLGRIVAEKLKAFLL